MILTDSFKGHWQGFKAMALRSLDSFTFSQIQHGCEFERREQRLKVKGTHYVFSDAQRNFNQGGAVADRYYFCPDGRYFKRLDRMSTQSNGWRR